MLGNNESPDPELQNFEKFNLAFAVVGIYLGVILEQKYMGTHIYPCYYDTSVCTSITRMLVCFAVGSPLVSGVLISKNNPYLYVVIFRNILPPTLGSLYLFGCSKWVALKFGLINKRKPNDEDDFAHIV